MEKQAMFPYILALALVVVPVQPIPNAATSPDAFIPAHAAVDHSGDLRSDVLGDRVEQLRIYEYPPERRIHVETSPRPRVQVLESEELCRLRSSAPMGSYVHSNPQRPKRRSTLTSLTRESIAVYELRATHVEPGFLSGEPGLLVTAELEGEIKSAPSIDTSEGLRLFLNQGKFMAGNYVFCIGSREIRSGDRFILFAVREPMTRIPQLIYVGEHFIVEREGKLSFPPDLSELSDHFDDLNAVVHHSCPN
jgi:hypothetical protein